MQAEATRPNTPQQAWDAMLRGNQRFIAGTPAHPRRHHRRGACGGLGAPLGPGPRPSAGRHRRGAAGRAASSRRCRRTRGGRGTAPSPVRHRRGRRGLPAGQFPGLGNPQPRQRRDRRQRLRASLVKELHHGGIDMPAELVHFVDARPREPVRVSPPRPAVRQKPTVGEPHPARAVSQSPAGSPAPAVAEDVHDIEGLRRVGAAGGCVVV